MIGHTHVEIDMHVKEHLWRSTCMLGQAHVEIDIHVRNT